MKDFRPAIAPVPKMKTILVPEDVHLTTREKQLLGFIMELQALKDMRTRSEKKHYGLKEDGEDWVGIHSRRLKAFIGNNYPHEINSLVRKGLIKRSRKYLTAKDAETSGREPFPKSVKILDEVMSSPMVKVQVPYRGFEIRKKKEQIEGESDHFEFNVNGQLILEEAKIGEQEKIEHQQKLCHVSLAMGCREAINEEFNRRIEAAQSLNSDTARREAYASANSFYAGAEACVNAIQRKDSWVTKCIGNRIHTAVTSLAGIIREYILIDGEKTSELDMGCAQPAMFGGILREFQELARTETGIRKIAERLREWDSQPRKEATKAREILSNSEYNKRLAGTGYECVEDGYGHKVFENKTKEYRQFVKKFTCEKHYEYSLQKRSKEIATLVTESSEEINRFVSQVSKGTYYESIQEASGVPTRKNAKAGVMKVLFESLKQRPSDERAEAKAKGEAATGEEKQTALKVRSAMRELFPALFRIIEITKAETYAGFSIALQRKESEIMICEELMEILSAFVHDAIIVKTSEWEQHKKTLEQRLKACKIEAVINVKHNEPKQYKEEVIKLSIEENAFADNVIRSAIQSFKSNIKSTATNASTDQVASQNQPTSSSSSLHGTQASPRIESKLTKVVSTPLNVVHKNITKNALFWKSDIRRSVTRAAQSKDSKTCHNPSSVMGHGSEARPPPWENEE
tara:strand:- start:18704 stop:20767 length:2064 start_codon:yes stop_codon:yes gene_type:complete